MGKQFYLFRNYLVLTFIFILISTAFINKTQGKNNQEINEDFIEPNNLIPFFAHEPFAVKDQYFFERTIKDIVQIFTDYEQYHTGTYVSGFISQQNHSEIIGLKIYGDILFSIYKYQDYYHDYNLGLDVYNISNIYYPKAINHFNITDASTYNYDPNYKLYTQFHFDGEFIYIRYLDKDDRVFRLRIIDFTDMNNPADLSIIEYPDADIDEFAVIDNYLYIRPESKDIFDIFNTTNIASPTNISTIDFTGFKNMKIQENYLYVSLNEDVQIYDVVSNKTNPDFISQFSFYDDVHELIFDEDDNCFTLAILSFGLFDLSNKASPILLDNYTCTEPFIGTYYFGEAGNSRLYLARESSEMFRTLFIFDYSIPTNITLLWPDPFTTTPTVNLPSFIVIISILAIALLPKIISSKKYT
ncbi:MAG: hypothetical protein FK734_03155 [Asgard group archaeon]|nr:hypothetical protein [Asgard group archaeon]